MNNGRGFDPFNQKKKNLKWTKSNNNYSKQSEYVLKQKEKKSTTTPANQKEKVCIWFSRKKRLQSLESPLLNNQTRIE